MDNNKEKRLLRDFERAFMPSKGKDLRDRPACASDGAIIGTLMALTFTALWPAEAWALNLGEMVCNLRNEMREFLPLFNSIAYVCGAVLAVKGALLLKKHTDNPNDSQIVKGVAHLLVGGALASLPVFAKVLQDSLHIVNTLPDGVKGCVPGEITGSTAQLDEMMVNLVGNIYAPISTALTVLCFVMGIFLIFRGLLRGAKVGGQDPRAGSPQGIIVNLVIGAILCTLAASLGTMLETLFGRTGTQNFDSLVNWSEIAGDSLSEEAALAANKTIKHVLMFVQIIGVISFIRGWLIVKNAVEGSGQATIAQGITHILGGTMAVNIGAMIRLFDETFGTGITN